jgi:single-stranded DNA-binding protein
MAIALNIAAVAGNLTEDPVLAYNPDQEPVCHLRIASNYAIGHGPERKEGTLFLDVVCKNGQALAVHKWVKKGNEILCSGRLIMEAIQYDEGHSKPRLTIDAREIHFVYRRGTMTPIEDYRGA